MHIGLSTTSLEPACNKGVLDGIGVYTGHLYAGLRAGGHTVTGLAFPPFGQPGAGGDFVHSARLPCAWVTAQGLGILTRGRFRLAPAVDLFHVTDYRTVPMRCPVVTSLHDAIPMKFPEMVSPRLRPLKNAVLRAAARFADHVITLSRYTVADLVEYYGIPEERISVVPCGVDRRWLAPLSAEERAPVLAKRGLRSGYFLTVGTLQPRKNVERILSAFTSLPAALRRERPLVVVGKAGWRCEALIARLRELEGRGEARWLTDVETECELRALYTGAGVFVFPSLYEGFGLPVLEAFACGVPVVTANTTTLPEVSAGAAHEVDPESVEAIRDGMLRLACDEQERERRIAAGRARATTMTWERVVERTVEVYRKVL